MMMGEESDWKTLAIEKQFQFFETLGSRPFDEIEKTNLFLLKKKVGFATCGKPSELPDSSNFYTGYKEENLKHIKDICEKIIEKSEYDPIRFACTILIIYHKNAICETSVFRIESNTGNIFIDAHSRVYQNWKQFMEENKLPGCEYCYPLEGTYSRLAEEDALVGFARSPASSLLNKATDCLDTAGSVVSVAAAAVFAASTFAAVAPGVVAAAATSAACTGVYSITRSASSLYDRNKHEQSIGLKDPESRSAWMAIGSSAVGVATIGALGKAKKVIESGESLSKLSIFGLHTLTTSSLVFSGFGFVETLIMCVDKYNKGILEKKDVFDLSCELLFLFNAIASAKATTKLVNNMSAAAAAEPSVQKKLTKTQKRNLRKRAAKRRAKGFTPNTNCEPTTDSKYSTTVKLLLLEAVRAYAPRVEEVMYNCQSIFHDILCWKSNEISDAAFMKNIVRSILRLYNDYKDEISEAIIKLVKFFTSLNLNNILGDIWVWFCNASEELKAIFCTKVINMEDQVESLISEAERDVTDLYDQLGVVVEVTPEIGSENSEELDEDDLNSESQRLLSGCGSVIAVSSMSCQDLEEFGEILDGVKSVVVSEFKSKVADYKKKLEAAKAVSGDMFDIKTYHKVLGITCDVGQHMFNETMQDLLAERTIYKIKCKCKDLKRERSVRTTPIWEGLREGMFHYYGPHGSGDLSESDLLSIVNVIVSEAEVTKEKCKLLKEKDVIMIEVPVVGGREIHIVVYCGITEENTASGLIIIAQ